MTKNIRIVSNMRNENFQFRRSVVGVGLFVVICLVLLSRFTSEVDGKPQNYDNRLRGGFSFPSDNRGNNNRGNGAGGNGNQLVSYENQLHSVIPGVGGTGIPCSTPGRFVIAPDGCNRCFCEQNGELSPACSRALCPPGFPSTLTSSTKFSN